MKHVSLNILSNDVLIEDEIDQLFDVLPKVTPPPFFVESIMAAVAQLPLPQATRPSSPWDALDVLHVTLDPQQLC